MNCPLSSTQEASVVYSVPQTPVTCTAVFDTSDEARAVPSGRVDLVVCTECGLAYNRAFDTELARIGAELDAAYETSQAASGHFSKFARRLAADWVERYSLQGKTVIEVGSGGGAFLTDLVHAGVGKVVAIDPLTPEHRGNDRIEVLNDTFGPRHLGIDAHALICRHTLEHVPNVSAFLQLVHDWATRQPGRVVLFELPSAERVIQEAAFWDIYYEHPTYFTKGTLTRAFEEAGFRLLRLELVYEDQYFLVETVAGSGTSTQWPAARDELHTWNDFGLRAQQAVEKCRSMLNRFAEDDGPVVLWQGAAKTVGLLAAAGSIGHVDCAVDLAPERQGRFLPGSALAVRAPNTLQSLQPSHIVLMNPVYFNEVRAQLDQMNVKGKLCTMIQLVQ